MAAPDSDAVAISPLGAAGYQPHGHRAPDADRSAECVAKARVGKLIEVLGVDDASGDIAPKTRPRESTEVALAPLASGVGVAAVGAEPAAAGIGAGGFEFAVRVSPSAEDILDQLGGNAHLANFCPRRAMRKPALL